ncbi:MAG: zinc metallopeptidase [Bacilli bacterium]|jgi:Zn-dependent membrane protease YugP|nr:zinc metallopeptidase [Bacilli bacterium]
MVVVVGLLIIVSVFAFIVEITLAIRYHAYNKKQNSLNKTGEQIARELLDKEGLQNIAVKATGSILFGNSYSHYFKKVRLRRLTWKKTSVSSLAMACQKSSLAVLDKEGDRDMRTRIILTPIIYFGPLAFVPMIVIGVLLDYLVLKTNGIVTLVFLEIASLIYVLSFVMSLLVLKTEKKAQTRALEIMEKDQLATPEEQEMCAKLFRLYNIEYVNDMVIALLELIYYVLQIAGYAQGGGFSTSSSKD